MKAEEEKKGDGGKQMVQIVLRGQIKKHEGGNNM